jgi:hypothetical protein
MRATARAVILSLGSDLFGVSSHSQAATPDLSPITTESTVANLQLSWQATPTCGDANTVASLIRDLLGDAPESQPPTRAHIQLTAHQSGYHVVIEYSEKSRKGRRDFDVNSCESAVDASTLIVVIALRPNMTWETVAARLAEFRGDKSHLPNKSAIAVLPDLEPVSSEKPELLAATPNRLDETRVPPRLYEPKRNVELPPNNAPKRRANEVVSNIPIHTTVRALVDTATLPSWSGGFVAGVGLSYAPWYVEAAGLVLLPRDATVPNDSARGASVKLIAGRMRLCADSRPPKSTVMIRPCTSLLLGELLGDAFGLPARHQAATYLATSFGGEAALRFRHETSFVTGIDVVVPLRRVSVIVDGVDHPLHRTALALQAWVGVDWAF